MYVFLNFSTELLLPLPAQQLTIYTTYFKHQEKTVRTDVRDATVFYKAQDDHQAYLEMNPYGYCNHAYRFTEWPN
jgi:peptide methionine sulfoxide reductase MsrA